MLVIYQILPINKKISFLIINKIREYKNFISAFGQEPMKFNRNNLLKNNKF